MTNREAIETLKIKVKRLKDCQTDGKMAEVTRQSIEAFELAIAALEKQEPKESPHKTPVMAKAFDGEGNALTYECVSCPNCKKWLSIFGTGKSYCPYCGQAVKSRRYNEQE